jgi:beta-mannosidase
MAGLAGRPSLAVVCGNSEVEQQVAMLGLDPALGRGELFGDLLPRIVAESGADAAYVPSAPCGEGLPMRPGRGVANYYGVGGYRRPLEDARRAGVRFAAECLAFANLGDEHSADLATGVARDVGSDWDFADVRDFYLGVLYGVDPAALRRDDPARYLELSRLVTGEVMAEVVGEWRRGRSRCGGGLVLWLRDLHPGAGWGVLDHSGAPKAAWYYLKRALAPVAVWSTDEGLGGVAGHVANDRPERLEATLRARLFRADGTQVGEASEALELAAHETIERDVESLLGRFADVSWAYRFGPPAQDAVVLGLERTDGSLISQSVRFPAGRPLERRAARDLGLTGRVDPGDDGAVRLTLRTEQLLYGVRLGAGGWTPQDDAFCLAPGEERTVWLAPRSPQAPPASVDINAVNLDGTLRVPSALGRA